MSTFICARCLARPFAVARTRQHASTAAFSTTAQREKIFKQQMLPKAKQRGRNTTPAKTSRQIAPGERKAFRKRVVLSNVNALAVHGLETIGRQNMSQTSKHGQMMTFDNNAIDALRANGAFKAAQAWGLFRQPATLVRSETLEVAKLLGTVDSSQGTVRRIVHGARGSGKSLVVMQSMAMALARGWVVIYLADTNALTNGQTAYVPETDSSGRTTYTQPDATAALLDCIAKSNSTVLSKLQLTMTHDLPIPIQANMSLQKFADIGAADPQIAWQVYKALFAELTAPSRPPVLFAVDSLSQLMRPTDYLAPDMTKIHAHDFVLLEHAVSILSGQTNLENGGMALFEDSASNRPANLTLDFALRRMQAVAKRDAEISRLEKFTDADIATSNAGEKENKMDEKGSQDVADVTDSPQRPRQKNLSPVTQALHDIDATGLPKWNALLSADQRVMSLINNPLISDLHLFEIGGLSKIETKGLMEYFAKSGLLRARVDNVLVGEKWAVAGGGNVGELQRACLWKI